MEVLPSAFAEGAKRSVRREGSASERGDIMETSKSCLCSHAATARQRAKTMVEEGEAERNDLSVLLIS